MPNWQPSPDHISSLVRAVNFLTNKRALIMEADYPLTVEQVIAVTTPSRLKELIDLGYDSLQKTIHIAYELGPEQGLGRRSITNVYLPNEVHYAFSRQLEFSYREAKPIFFNREAIDDETMAKLKDWTERAVYERRLAALVVDTVTMFFKHRGNEPLTMYHIMARWRAIRVVFPHIDYGYGARGRDMWEKHGNSVGRDLHRWDWPQWGTEAAWREKYKKRLALAEETLLSCVSLPKPKADTSYRSREFRATLSDWQKLGDQPF
jgi:hypothetical protein